ncbi:sulfide/dihydroorotate dehydrogenase-like FAD/NAD-binding protein [Clostridium sporogenes]|uniref:Sulfide/dihydroorotate dehydrogenase-like FAD/NAD-binding protein n=2 Tax=Clostridium TaxID=1485 RepID=A0A6M0SYH6_CLOBO|nr:sulfide/dihydroorotate dehydrogenase-like FAD/NAD-binding protein [Clostridium sporogenes]NFA60183.1 sulfide/dihydroorotate dehydrogenase-like FAD/NAD-binding protein [Clostridium botulinum]MDS1002358.1 sulfide/dihydroorotate dehydrogenase-like FAD/NAD-binding protein [Clostridium sporogenes]NFI72842.1 sulfide/dihydroorotate dehydrogenase-like FAD/NAD-binding protein [Clostridium sporogenes]NFL72371.1 sulfide/dihydroorotate dehydrogenase-like FAD/NAD-binding protein [Clostridium sporogenes]
MEYEIKDCIDAGSEYCPCHLAETGDCILCSQLSGKKFCDCINWKGVCIYQEFMWNGKKAKEERETYLGKILEKNNIEDKTIVLTIALSHRLCQQLVYPGSFVFLRNKDDFGFYDAPISIMDANTEENIIKVAIEIRGVKTKTIADLDENDDILVRGPFWNGVLGLKNVYRAKNGTSILISRGIGQAPLVPVMKKLNSNGNKIIAIIDNSGYENILIKDYLKLYNAEVIELNTLKAGELTDDLKNKLKEILDKEDINIIHCSSQDIIIYKLVEFLDDKVPISSSNNAKMCCGEGVCGTCTVRYKGHIVKRLCKIQTEPKYVFRERRLI